MKISAAKTVYAAVVLCGLAYAFVALRGPNGIPGLLEKRHQVAGLERDNAQLQREIADKQARIQRLESNPAEQEFVIRKELKLARPNEKIYILDDKGGGKK